MQLLPKTAADMKAFVLDDMLEVKLYQAGGPDSYSPHYSLWASEAHWLAPAKRLQPLADKYGLPYEVGSWRLDKQPDSKGAPVVTKLEVDPPAAGMLRFLDPSEYTVPLEIEGTPARYIRSSWNRWANVLRRPDGKLVAVRADYLAFLTLDDNLDGLEPGYGYQFDGDPILRQRDAQTVDAVGVFANRVHITGGHKDDDGHWIPAKDVPDGERLIGVVMPVRINEWDDGVTAS